MIKEITPEHDSKLQQLLELIKHKIENPINQGNKKVLIFTAFADTAKYLYDHVSIYAKETFGLDTAMVTGSISGKSTLSKKGLDLNSILTYFSPISKGRNLITHSEAHDLDILIATDCISEGQNLQDCDYLINYDIHWNPVRIIQRFGRIDRIGSQNKVIQLVNLWPDISLDEYIHLKSKIETRMKIVDLTATADDNMLSPEEEVDLNYRKKQLERLQTEVVDIEEMSSGISIMDFGLNEFRLDLLEYMKEDTGIEHTPNGLHAVVSSNKDAPSGVIYVLKNRSNNINQDNQNRLHPFYMVYISNEGDVIVNHLSPKEMLDKVRSLCKGKKLPIDDLCQAFNQETNNGRHMDTYSELLQQAIASIIEVKEESDVTSFLFGEDVSFYSSKIKGLDDFELISFLIIK